MSTESMAPTSTRRLEKYAALLLAMLALFVLGAAAGDSAISRRMMHVAMCVVLVTGVLAVSGHRRLLWIVGGPAGAGVVIGSVYEITDIAWLLPTAQAINISLLLLVAAIVLIDVLRDRQVTGDTICGAVCVYLLIGLAGSLGFALIVGFNPSALASSDAATMLALSEEHVTRNTGDFIYFGFVTMTALGYGDITPVSPPARMLAWMLAVVGQLFVAILIARLVGLHVAGSKD